MISNAQQSQLKVLLQSPQWGAAAGIAEELCAKIAADPKARETEWETLKKVLDDEGQIKGIRRFIKELTVHALGD